MKKVVIVGGGIRGLSLAYCLKGKAHVTIVEKSNRLGGWIQTDEVDGFLFDRGPHSARTQGAFELAKELGLEPLAPAAKKRFLWTGGKLQALPTNPLGLFFNPLLRGIRGAIWRERKVPVGTADDESVATFFTRRFGPEVTARLVDPIVSGIFAGDTETLSMRAAFGNIWKGEQKYGSVFKGFRKCKGKKVTFSFKEGMEALPRALERAIDATVHLNTTAGEITQKGVATNLGFLEADQVYSTAPQPTLPYTSVATVNLGYSGKVLPEPGFGYLIPSREKEPILGVLWPSEVFPDQNRGEQTRLTVMLGGARQPIPENPEKVALDAIERHLGITAQPDAITSKINRGAIPHFPVGYSGETIPVSIGDCIASSKALTS